MKQLLVVLALLGILLVSGCTTENPEITIKEVTYSCTMSDGTLYHTYAIYEGVNASLVDDFEWLKDNYCEWGMGYTDELLEEQFKGCIDSPFEIRTNTYHITHSELVNIIKNCKEFEEMLNE